MAVRKTSTKKTATTPKKTVRKSVRKTEMMEPVLTQEMTEATVSRFPQSVSGFMENRKLVLSILGLLALLLLGYLFAKWAVIAFVDYRPITRFSLYKQLDQKFGEGIKEQMISEALILSESRKRNVDVSQDEVNAEYKKYEDQLGSKDALESALKAQNIAIDDFRNQLRIQLLIKKMFGQGVNVSDEEVNKYYEENKEQYQATSEDASSTAKLHDQIKDQLVQQKVSEAFRKWLGETQKSNRVVRY